MFTIHDNHDRYHYRIIGKASLRKCYSNQTTKGAADCKTFSPLTIELGLWGHEIAEDGEVSLQKG